MQHLSTEVLTRVDNLALVVNFNLETHHDNGGQMLHILNTPSFYMSHPHDLFDNRRQFQLERLILFSDAVFAIAITLMVIEIKVPELEERTAANLQKALFRKLPDVMGFLLSFVIIGMFWINHHRLFGFINNFSTGLLWRNLHILFWIALMPFTSATQIRYGNFSLPWILYSINLGMIALSIYFVWRHIGKPQLKLSTLTNDPAFLKYNYTRSFTIACIFLLGAVLSLTNSLVLNWVSRFVFFLIFPALAIIKKRYGITKNKYPE